MNFSQVKSLYIFAKFFKINYSDNLTKKKNIFAGSIDQ